MSDLSEYYLNSRSDVKQLDLIEISHSQFSKVYRIVRNWRAGVTVDLSPDQQDVAFEYYPLQVELEGNKDDLDSSIKVNLGDLGEVVPSEIDRIAEANAWDEKPQMRHWTFQSDNLTQPLSGPFDFEIPAIAFTEEGASFEASAPQLNLTKTGERITLVRFPMQRGITQ